MPRVYLIRHGRPTSGWGRGEAGEDPGLDPAGRTQAEAARDALLALPEALRPRRVVSSPLRRCRETAEPLALALGVEVEIDPRVGEIPTPPGLAHGARSDWLRRAFASSWREVEGGPDYAAWRVAVAEAAAGLAGAAVFTHFVAVNAVLSHLSGDERVLSFQPDHASITVLEASDGALRLIAKGREAATSVL